MDHDHQLAKTDHPRPWHGVRARSGIVIKDALGATVLLLPFTGLLSRERKARVAAVILDAVNALPEGAEASSADRERVEIIKVPAARVSRPCFVGDRAAS